MLLVHISSTVAKKCAGCGHLGVMSQTSFRAIITHAFLDTQRRTFFLPWACERDRPLRSATLRAFFPSLRHSTLNFSLTRASDSIVSFHPHRLLSIGSPLPLRRGDFFWTYTCSDFTWSAYATIPPLPSGHSLLRIAPRTTENSLCRKLVPSIVSRKFVSPLARCARPTHCPRIYEA
jgi:hypothetical protein